MRSVAHYEVAARLFAEGTGVGDGRSFASLTAGEVSQFVVDFCARPVKVSLRELVSCLRSFLRFCHLKGLTTTAASTSWGCGSVTAAKAQVLAVGTHRA